MSAQLDAIASENTLLQAWKIVKGKGAAGGIDGVSVSSFERNWQDELARLSVELHEGKWRPQPYLDVSVAKQKTPSEYRHLGLTSVRDKVVQQAIKIQVEPRLERIFSSCSYGYRPNRGAVRAIKRVIFECGNRKYQWALRLDVDNFFDTIDHDILKRRLLAVGVEVDVVFLIMLCIEMGRIQNLRWVDTPVGTPQGAVLSPMLANLYLHSFDQFAASRNVGYVRYADDFVFLCPSREVAEDIFHRSTAYLFNRLHLTLNTPEVITTINEGFEFLGITVKGTAATLGASKRAELIQRIEGLEFGTDGFSDHSKRTLDGIANYYARLLPQADIEVLDEAIKSCVAHTLQPEAAVFSNRTQALVAIKQVSFLSNRYRSQRKAIVDELLNLYLAGRDAKKMEQHAERNSQIILQRKQEYRRIETQASGLLVDKPGSFIGLTNRGVTVSHRGTVVSQYRTDNLSHIVVTGNGVSLSSNLIAHCAKNKIPIDFFDYHGGHTGSLIAPSLLQTSLWHTQASLSTQRRHELGMAIIEGKIKNQHALLKYLHKYHKARYPALEPKMEAIQKSVDTFKQWKKTAHLSDDDFIAQLMGHEAQVAVRYWDYFRELIVDDGVVFERRVHQGATDLMNSMLNYGYALLYVRMWQALLGARLNPFDSLIHAPQAGKPTLVFDMVEIFRSQVVDRVVITLIQRGHQLSVDDEGLLDESTRKLLVKSVMERLVRYEKYQNQDTRMEQIITKQATDLAQAIVAGTRFKPYVFKW